MVPKGLLTTGGGPLVGTLGSQETIWGVHFCEQDSIVRNGDRESQRDRGGGGGERENVGHRLHTLHNLRPMSRLGNITQKDQE